MTRRQAVAAAAAAAVVVAVWAADRAQTRRIPLGEGRAGVVSRIRTAAPLVALTFDDGPHPAVTSAVLDLLAATRTPATFFVIGRFVEARPELVRRIVAGGHEVANHTWSHRVLTIIPAREAADEIGRGGRAIAAVTGMRPAWVRPPQGSATDATVRAARTQDQRVALWSVALDEGAIRDRPLDAQARRLGPGDVILAHDVCPTASAAECAELIPRALARLRAFIDAVRARGYRFVTLSELAAAGA